MCSKFSEFQIIFSRILYLVYKILKKKNYGLNKNKHKREKARKIKLTNRINTFMCIFKMKHFF